MNIIHHLEPPLFYRNPIGLRFEIGPEEIPYRNISDGSLNQEYFDAGLIRALSIFESLFSGYTELIIVLQDFSDGRSKISKGNKAYALCSHSSELPPSLSKRRDVHRDTLGRRQYCWNRAVFSSQVSKLDYRELLRMCLYSDFAMGFGGDCYVLSPVQDLLFHLYDDRGLDVVSTSKERLSKLYRTFNDWILEYDRDRIVKTFEGRDETGQNNKGTFEP